MSKEIERAGLPCAHVCSIVPISKTVGANRIVPSVAIPHPLGDPAKSPDEERAIRRRLLERALEALATPIETQTVFTTD
jgi:betaine reductase